MKKSVYEIINKRIFAELEKGIIPWRKPWITIDRDGNFIPPQNFITRRPYQGINFSLLNNAFDEPFSPLNRSRQKVEH
jgi:antirestriction protein ArdC